MSAAPAFSKPLRAGGVVLAALWLIAADLAAVTAPKRKQLSVRGGLNVFGACGSVADYRAGENDFPVNPAFAALTVGLGLSFFSSPSSAFGIDVAYGASAAIALRDPSDGETIRATTPRNLTVACSLLRYLRLARALRFSVCLGVGAEWRLGKEKEYLSDLGSRIIIAAPAPALSPLAVAGIGSHWLLSRTLAVGLECRPFCFFRSPIQLLVCPALTLGLKF